ncbi:hypothetical protein GCM10009730_61710 [Streptomyces albidochromogenes]
MWEGEVDAAVRAVSARGGSMSGGTWGAGGPGRAPGREFRFRRGRRTPPAAGHGQRPEQGEDGGRGEDRPRRAFGVRLVLGDQQTPLRGGGLGAEAEEAEGGQGQGDAG